MVECATTASAAAAAAAALFSASNLLRPTCSFFGEMRAYHANSPPIPLKCVCISSDREIVVFGQAIKSHWQIG